MDDQHLPAGDSHAATLVERFVRGAVVAAVRRGEVDQPADGLADMLLGLVRGAAFQIGRGNIARADRMLGATRWSARSGAGAIAKPP